MGVSARSNRRSCTVDMGSRLGRLPFGGAQPPARRLALPLACKLPVLPLSQQLSRRCASLSENKKALGSKWWWAGLPNEGFPPAEENKMDPGQRGSQLLTVRECRHAGAAA